MVTSASTFIITMGLRAPIVVSATSAPTFGLPVASMTTSTRWARHTSANEAVAAMRPRSIAASTADAPFTTSTAATVAPAIACAARTLSTTASATATTSIPAIWPVCITMSVPICPAPISPTRTGRPSRCRRCSASASEPSAGGMIDVEVTGVPAGSNICLGDGTYLRRRGTSTRRGLFDQSLRGRLVGDQHVDRQGRERGAQRIDLATAARGHDDPGGAPHVFHAHGDHPLVGGVIDDASGRVEELAQHVAHGAGLAQARELGAREQAFAAQRRLRAEVAHAREHQ